MSMEPPNDIERVENLLRLKKFAEAREALNELFAGKLPNAAVGGLYVKLLSAYLEASNAANETYVTALDEVIAALEDVKKRELALADSVRLAEARAGIKRP